MNLKNVIIIIALISSFLTGCTNVQPWERGNLAKAEMALDPYPAQSLFRSHSYGSREAAQPSVSAGGGGGCGCY